MMWKTGEGDRFFWELERSKQQRNEVETATSIADVNYSDDDSV
jgi:hypothetical protein